ncbi:MAG: hypothetical protein MUP86_00470 [Dehalococcoidia bacterium]|nr:hypothetical protein [Dehalococcoidia bacterium]
MRGYAPPTRLDEGGGVVCLAFDETTHLPVALKDNLNLSPQAEFLATLRRPTCRERQTLSSWRAVST